MKDGDNYIFLEKGLGKCSRMTNVKGCQVRSCGSIWESLLFIRGFPHSSVGKESVCSAGDPDLIPESGRSAGEAISYPLQYSWASLVAQLVMNLLAMQETWVWSLGWEYPLEKGKATHSSILAWRIPWTVQCMCRKEQVWGGLASTPWVSGLTVCGVFGCKNAGVCGLESKRRAEC